MARDTEQRSASGHVRRHASEERMQSYLKVVALIVVLVGAWNALLPLVA